MLPAIISTPMAINSTHDTRDIHTNAPGSAETPS
jgi:hypothetical protein